jgi:peptidoglycan hydrolase-like protein with peptidoglycan-binding domain
VTKIILSFMAVLAMTWVLSAETIPPKSTKRRSQPAHKSTSPAAKGPTVPSSAAKSATTTTTAAKSTSAKSISKRKGKTTARRTVRSYQQTPTPERYQEIQQALAKKGYFQEEANGQWGTSSAEALKRFQADQNLMPDGKLNSLSLIALGLGPKRLSAQSKPPNAPPPAPAPQ